MTTTYYGIEPQYSFAGSLDGFVGGLKIGMANSSKAATSSETGGETTASPKGSITSVILQRLVKGKWVNANKLSVNADGSITAKLVLKAKGSYTMRLIRPATKAPNAKPEIVSNIETFIIS